VDAVFRKEMRESGIPSAMLALVHGDHVVLAKAWGMAGPSVPADEDTPFCIGSISKSFTALGVMILADEGKVDLLAPVTTYLPRFRMADPRYRDIKVRDLLRHTSGLVRSQGELVYAGEGDTAAALIARLATVKLVYAPGSRYDYCNLNYVLAGAVIEAASGRSYLGFMEERIFRPLGMTGTGAAAAAERSGTLAQGGRGFFGWTLTGHPKFPGGATAAGYFATTARDFAAYLLFMRRGGVAPDGRRLVSEAGFKAMTEAQTEGGYYGYGWVVGDGLIFHDGAVAGFVSNLDLARDPGGWGFAYVLGKSDNLAETFLGRSVTRVEVDLYDLLMPGSPVFLTPVSMAAYRAACLAAGALLLAFLAWRVARVARNHVRSASRELATPGNPTSAEGAASRPSGWKGFARPAVAVALDLGLPLAILLGVRRAGSWALLMGFIPDFGCFLLVLAGGSLAVGALRLSLWLSRTVRRRA